MGRGYWLDAERHRFLEKIFACDASRGFLLPMQPRRWIYIYSLLLSLCSLAVSGCAKRATPAEAGLRTQTLLLGNGAEPADLDPQVVTAYSDQNILNALFEGLTALDEQTEVTSTGVTDLHIDVSLVSLPTGALDFRRTSRIKGQGAVSAG